MPTLYRIERIIKNYVFPNYENYREGRNYDYRGNNNLTQVVLEVIPDDINLLYNNDGGENYAHFQTFEISNDALKLDTGTRLYEGMFVFYDTEFNTFISGRNDDRAQTLIQDNKRYRESIINKNIISDAHNKEDILWYYANVDDCNNITSYHVNVGHGNCSIILIQQGNRYQVWMIDCGLYDYRNGHSYVDNINNAFINIANKLQLDVNDIKINRFYLTHWHYDHYSGLEYLINCNKIDSSTVFCMNLYYSISSVIVNRILHLLDNLNVVCYEPTSKLHSLSDTSILHPECRIRRWKKVGAEERRVRKINDSSAVYAINLAGKTMILPGDLEQKGITQMVNCRTCSSKLYDATYFCVPHHASSTGDMNIACPCRGYAINCVNNRLSYAIIMGRDGAFNGIYDPHIIASYNNVVFSEFDQDCNTHGGVVIDWGTNAITSI